MPKWNCYLLYLHAILKKMNRFFIATFLFFGLNALNAQIYEAGIFLGGANYIGDIGPTTYIAPNEFAYGFLFKWNKSPRHSWRISYQQSKITSDDSNSDMNSRVERDFDFENNLKVISAGLEFNFFVFNLHDSKPQFTPYVYSGLSYLKYDALFFLGDDVQIDKNRGAIAIPMTVGVKGRVFEHFVLGLEVNINYAFVDDLDGSNSVNDNLTPLQFGNINSNDWYVFTGLTLTYTFGKKPCYCND